VTRAAIIGEVIPAAEKTVAGLEMVVEAATGKAGKVRVIDNLSVRQYSKLPDA
jgi:hypothetical protein